MLNVKSTSWDKSSVNSTGWTKSDSVSTGFTKSTVASTNFEPAGIFSEFAILAEDGTTILMENEIYGLGQQA